MRLASHGDIMWASDTRNAAVNVLNTQVTQIPRDVTRAMSLYAGALHRGLRAAGVLVADGSGRVARRQPYCGGGPGRLLSAQVGLSP